mgnify:CR=1 FL=1
MTTIWRPERIRVEVRVVGEPRELKQVFYGPDAFAKAMMYIDKIGRIVSDIYVLESSGAGHREQKQYMEVPVSTDLKQLAQTLPGAWGLYAHVHRKITVRSPNTGLATVTSIEDRRHH